ncbi:MAG: HlyC/CorC family transporter [Armatimonadetes bacterium]|nr:HlyC/CorC family transporter [Armatimonadota bacterium]
MDPAFWIWVAVLAFALAVAGQALLSYWETAVINARRSRLVQMADEHSRRARAAEALLEHSERFETAAHAAETITEAVAYSAAVAAGLAIVIAARPMDPAKDVLLPGLPAVVIGLLIAVPIVLLFGQTIPKAWATRAPERAVLLWLPLIRGFTLAMAPVVLLLGGMARVFARAAGAQPNIATRAAHTEEEIKFLVEGSAEEGVLEEEEKEMIHSIFEFTETVARQVMVPRTSMKCLPADATVDQAVDLILREGHSRIPIYEETVDRIIGVIHAKDLLPYLREGKGDTPVRALMREPFFVPEGKKIDELLREFRAAHTQMAIVVDEFGGTSGLVTLEDVLEEIVGEIQDEYDVEEAPVQPVDEHTAIVDARLSISDVNEALGLSLPEEEYDTLGGLVFGLFGRMPAVGEQVSLNGVDFVVERTDGHRLLKIRVVRHHPEHEEAGGEALGHAQS